MPTINHTPSVESFLSIISNTNPPLYEINQTNNALDLNEGMPKTKRAKKLAIQLLDLRDQLYDVVAANHFYYEAVESIMTRYDEYIDKRVHHGWNMTSDWLETSQHKILQTLDEIRLGLVDLDLETEHQEEKYDE